MAGLGLALLILLLEVVAASDRAGVTTLEGFSPFVRFLTGAGSALEDVLLRHLALLRWVLAATAALGAFLLAWKRRGGLKRDLPILFGVHLLALSATFLGASPLAAVLLGAAGGAGLVFVPAREHDGPPWSALWLALPLGLAILLRFYALDATPEGYSEHAVVHHVDLSLEHEDVLFALLGAGRIQEAVQTAWKWIVEEQFGLMSLLAAIGFKAVGVSLTISRSFSAVAGTLAVLCAYFCGKGLFDRRVGLAFSFLLAICPWHLAASRYGDLEHVLATLQFLLAIALYAAAIRRGRTVDWLLAGAAVGVSWFVYASNQVLPAIVGIHLLLMFGFRRGFFRRSWWKVLLFSAVVAGLGSPVLATIARDRALKPNIRTGYLSGKPIPLGDLERNGTMARTTLRELFQDVDDPWFVKPDGGLSATEKALFVPGILLCVAGLFVREARWASAFVLCALPLSLLPGILGPDPSFRRVYLTAILALLIAAVVLVRAFDGLRRLVASPGLPAATAATLAVVLALTNAHVYFDVAQVFAEDSCRYYTALARAFRARLGTEFLYVYTPSAYTLEDTHRYIRLEAYETLDRLSKEGRGAADLYEIVVGRRVLDVLAAPRRTSGGVRILAEAALVNDHSGGFDLKEAIRTAYPGAREEEILGPDRAPLVRMWWLP